MRSLKTQSPAVPRPRVDPAPSRLNYRLNRLWLTPLVRAVVRVGAPAFVLSFSMGYWISNERTIEAVSLTILDLRASITQRDEFQVRVMVIPGASPELAQDIREVAGVDFPVSSFDLSMDEIVASVGQLDAVARVSAALRPGGVLELVVQEREAAVLWQSRDGLEALDDKGHRVGLVASREARPGLPLIVGDGADLAVPEAMELLATAEPLGERLGGLVRVGARRWDLVMLNGPRVKLPEVAPVEALRRVLAAQSAEDILDRDLRSVDMRNPRRPVLRLNPDALEEMRAMRSAAATEFMKEKDG